MLYIKPKTKDETASKTHNHSMNTFNSLTLPKAFIDHLTHLGFQVMTEVQQKSLPTLLAQQDCIVKAKTGSGKTLAFGIGAIHALNLAKPGPQALILAPTRELADQIARTLRQLASLHANIKVLTLCGGVPIEGQVASLKHIPHIIVATPGRLLRLLDRDVLSLKHLRYVVLDEADRMFEMGFDKAIAKIEKLLPSQRQTLLFSATYPASLHEVAQSMLKNPTTISLEEKPSLLDEWVIHVSNHHKLTTLLDCFDHYLPSRVLVFCNAKATCDALQKSLEKEGILAMVLHGDKDQKERTDTLERFHHGSAPLLLATEVAARGLDISDIPLIINYDVPRSPQSYTHRIGRTARNDTHGQAVTFVDKEEFDLFQAIQSIQGDLSIHPPLQAKGTWPPQDLPVTFYIHAGKKDKLRAGDIVGALLKEGRIANDALGDITILETRTYLCVKHAYADHVENALKCTPIKKRKFKSYRFPS